VRARHPHAKAQHHAKRRPHRLHLPPLGTRILTPPMVDRLFWRAGFGPSQADRDRWTGRTAGAAAEYLLSTPQGPPAGPNPTNAGKPLSPTSSDTDLVLSWLDQMVRAPNPFVERMTFFWHRHFANSRDEVSPPQLLLSQTGLFRKYSDFGRNPKASFKDLTYAVTEDPSMLRYLNGEQNNAKPPRIANENYARELMELFTLGVTNSAGQPNYSETDVHELAKAMSGWRINDADPNNVVSFYDATRHYPTPVSVLGTNAALTDRQGVDVVLNSPAHAPYLLTKLWGEFISLPIDAGTLAQLRSLYLPGFQLRPVLTAILTHPALYASPSEPTLIKTPVVYVVGILRALRLGITDGSIVGLLDQMGQRPYFPPTVAGWEGGPAWMTTNGLFARFKAAGQILAQPGLTPKDSPSETPEQAVDTARLAVGNPWVADATLALLRDYAHRAPQSTPKARIVRQLVLRTFLLGGPDAQVC
jgi:uncharacterized protein (DUF1800 family)